MSIAISIRRLGRLTTSCVLVVALSSAVSCNTGTDNNQNKIPSLPVATTDATTLLSQFAENQNHHSAEEILNHSADPSCAGHLCISNNFCKTSGYHCTFVSVDGSDDSPGSEQQPYKTIQHAVDQSSPGTAVIVESGTYRGNIRLHTHGEEDNRIKLISRARWGARLEPGDDGSFAVIISEADYVDIIGFEVDGSAGTVIRGGIGTFGSQNRVLSNLVHDINAPCDNTGGSGIAASPYHGGTDMDIVSNVVFNIHSDRNACKWVHGIYHSTTGHIVNNLVYNNAFVGIHLWHHARDLVIAHNTVASHPSCGILVGAGDKQAEQPTLAKNVRVTNNIVFNNNPGVCEGGIIGFWNRYRTNLVYSDNNAKRWELRYWHWPRNSISADPSFLNYEPGGKSDYRLDPSSPAVGSAQPLDLPYQRDLAGWPRPTAQDQKTNNAAIGALNALKF